MAHNDILVAGTNPSDAEILQKGEAGNFQDQNVTTYTIGFQSEQDLLETTASRGGGAYYTANNASTLNEALNSIINDISTRNEGFSAAAVPVSRANKIYAGEYVYYGLFQPLNAGNWVGNLKKYGITDSGVIQDVNGNDIVSGGTIVDNAQSFWSTTADGPAVAEGGAGEKLYNDIHNGFTRKIYTYTATVSGADVVQNLTDPVNAFTTANTSLNTAATPSVPLYSGLTDDVIEAVRQEDGDWPLGSFLHSQPLVVHYNIDDTDTTNDKSMIYAGANDGMLHCFDDDDGSEQWAFIPRDLLPNLSSLDGAASLQYFVDGSPVLYTYDHDNDSDTEDKKILIFGERRGGDHYTALDVSDYAIPTLVYEIDHSILRYDDNGTTVGEYLGQSWQHPEPLTMQLNSDATTNVLLMTGGYDDNQDSLTPAASDSKGRAVFAVNAQTGALFSSFNFSHDNFSSMTHSIVSANGFENPKSEVATRVYAGDMNGNLFAFRDDVYSLTASDDGVDDGVWGQKIRLYSSPGKKIFYAPNIVNEFLPVSFSYTDDDGSAATTIEQRIGDYVFYGTGDRAHPTRTDIENRFYAIKNSWDWSGSQAPTIVEAYVDTTDGKVKKTSDNSEIGADDLFILDVTDDLLQNKETDEDTQRLYMNYITDAIDHTNNRGWFIRFVEGTDTLKGEKMVSTPIIFNGVIYFTTYVPDTATTTSTDPCENPGASGTGYLWALDYKYGGAAMDFYEDPQLPGEKHREDRNKQLHTSGIPPQPVLIIQEGKPTIITGYETTDPKFNPVPERFYWRQISQ